MQMLNLRFGALRPAVIPVFRGGLRFASSVLVGLALLAVYGFNAATPPQDVPVGAILSFAGPASKIPAGWLPCDGRPLQKQQYPTLFNTVGTTYGGVATDRFNLPDLQGRVAVGTGGVQGGHTYQLAQVIGTASLQLPSHAHEVARHHHTWMLPGGGADLSTGGQYHSEVIASNGTHMGAQDPKMRPDLVGGFITTDNGSTTDARGAATLDNFQPSLAVTCIIRAR